VKLLALRVAAFRRFAQPAAVEGFGDGINVLAGPNEMGKSTLFRALEAAFLTRYKVTGAALDDMRPHAGGEPLVEAEFEAQGRRWSIRKQFGRGASAVLTDVSTGKDVARNAEAEERLALLTGRSGDLPGGLGLVWVRQQRSLLPPDPDTDPENGKEKSRGERAVLRDLIGREIEAAAAGDAFEIVRDKAKRALDQLRTPTRMVKKDGPLFKALAAADVARVKRDEARSAAATAEQRLTHIAAMSQRLAELECGAAGNTLASRVESLEARRVEAVEARGRLNLLRETMKAREAELNAAREASASRQKRLEAADTRRKALSVAQNLSVRIEALASELNADAATPAVVEKLAAVDRARAIAEAELAGQSAYVDVRLEPGGKDKLRIGDAPLGESRRFSVVEPLEIRIDGIAAITVSTAQAGQGAKLKARSASAASEIDETLRRLGVATLAQARERALARAAKVKDLDEARARFSEIAPAGLQSLAAEVASLDEALKTADQQKMSDDDVTRLKSEAREARANFDALNARVVSDENFRALESELAEARRGRVRLDDDIKRLTIDLAREQGEQTGIDESGRAAEVAACEGEFERAEKEVRRLQHEADALQLLETTLAGIEAGAKSAYFEPISRRLRPRLERLFGTSELFFKDEFLLDAFERGGVREDLAELSDGTREQLSILVRVAFAEVLAENGNPAPLILDDPLAYSDDGRLAAICGELAAAKSVSQIILLTCREKAFAVLPGRRLTVTNWRPEKT
jgi:energy-coupling factor transporter ATP-binding protein EcfA2